MKAPVLCADEVQTFISVWEIGADGAHTKKAGVLGTGFASVARTAAGKYTVTFSTGMPAGGLVDFKITPWHVADEEPYNAQPTQGTFTAETASAAATVKYESWVIDETAAQTDFPDTAEVTLTATFLKTKGT